MAYEKYLIAFDMDGTLLNSQKEITPRSKELVRQLIAEGNDVTIATGRPDRVVIPYYVELGMNGPLVSYNGAKVVKPNDPSFPAFRKMIPASVIRSFLTSFGYDKIDKIMAESDTTIYLNKHDPDLDGFYHPEGMRTVVGNVAENIQEGSYILIIGMPNHDWDERLVKCAFSYPGLGIRFWGGVESRFSEMYYLDVSKTSGLTVAMEDLHMDKDHVIVIGDADNDVDMLTHFPHSIAMVNGEKQVKLRASAVSDFDNDHDGAALAVLKMVHSLQGRE